MKKFGSVAAQLFTLVGFFSVLEGGCSRQSVPTTLTILTNTPTPSATLTVTPLGTPTRTATLTPPAATSTLTNTATNTPTMTPLGPSSTFTSTATNTLSNTPTNTQATSTFTATATNTFTNTITATATTTATNTASSTPTNTQSTNTFTNTATATVTNTQTNTMMATDTLTNTATSTITSTPSNTATATITNTPGAGASPFTLYQCGTWSAAPYYGSVLTGGTNVPSYNATFTGNGDNLDTACFAGTADNFDMGIPPSGVVLSYVAIMPSTATVNLTGLTTCTFDAWCTTTTGFNFGVGLAAGDNTLTPVTLSSTWTNYQMTLPVSDLSAAATMFYLNYTGTTAGQNLAIDQIEFK